MNREYRKHLKDTFNDVQFKHLEKFSLIDIFNELKPHFTNSGFVFNGSLNLLINFNYSERRLTSGFNFNVINMSFLNAQIRLEKIINDFKSKWYEISIVEIDKTELNSKTFPRFKIILKVKIKNTELTFNFSIDIASEELPFSETIINDNGFKYYSLERTLASKYVAAIMLGAGNDRVNDFIDIVFMFFKITDYKTLYLITRDIIHKRKISTDTINQWLVNYDRWTSRWDVPHLNKILTMINDMVFPEVTE